MKTASLLLALSLSFFAGVASADPGKALLCELVDLGRSRILDRHQSVIDPQSRKPILMMMGAGPVVGKVRDFPGRDILNRKLELTLDYNAGSENGHSQAATQYRVDQDGTSSLLAEVGLNGEFGQVLSLRCFLRQVAPAVDFSLMSSTTMEYGRGQSSSFCDGDGMSYFCIDSIKRRAQDDAVRDAEFSCRMRQGTSRSYSRSCSDNCFPYSIPPGSRSQMVSCSSSCTVTCEIP